MQQLADFPAETLHETILQFHDTPNRYRNFHRALQADPLGRAKEVEAEIAFALAREPFAHRLVDALAQGALPLRCTHNDTKLNNILLDEKTGQAVCVIDLDTVMPGLAAYDFGDSIRFGANPAAEDERDLSKVNFSVEYYEAYRKGYLETAGCGADARRAGQSAGRGEDDDAGMRRTFSDRLSGRRHVFQDASARAESRPHPDAIQADCGYGGAVAGGIGLRSVFFCLRRSA